LDPLSIQAFILPGAIDNRSGGATIPGDKDIKALQPVFQKLAERHPMLRTLFFEQSGEPYQCDFSGAKSPAGEKELKSCLK
jgi:hypothetical protein